jgi:hypothetical protein
MLGADENENKPVGKGGKRKSGQPGKKTERSRKAVQTKETPDQLQAQAAAQEAIIEAPVAAERLIEEPAVQEPTSVEVEAPVVAVKSSTELGLPTETPVTPEAPAASTAGVSVQAITNAYGDYSWKSLDQARTFFEQLAGVRSLDKALQLQSEFAREAYDTFVAESRRIRELHGALAKQRLGSLEEFVARMTRPPR